VLGPEVVSEVGWPAAAVRLTAFGGRTGASALKSQLVLLCIECRSDGVSLTPSETDAVKSINT
jgi:hypothetical protein